MAVLVTDSAGKTYQGKFAAIKAGEVHLYSGVMSDKKGGFRGCGKKVGVFPVAGVTIRADQPDHEMKSS